MFSLSNKVENVNVSDRQRHLCSNLLLIGDRLNELEKTCRFLFVILFYSVNAKVTVFRRSCDRDDDEHPENSLKFKFK